MKKTTYIVIAIIIVLVLIVGYLILLFGAKRSDAESGNLTACEELGCTIDDVYVGSVNSDKYYECSCHYARRINLENVVCFKTDEEALADNRTKSEC